jgi:hypothetical protein
MLKNPGIVIGSTSVGVGELGLRQGVGQGEGGLGFSISQSCPIFIPRDKDAHGVILSAFGWSREEGEHGEAC